MSKATALAMLTGDPNAGAAAKPSLITPDVNPNPEAASNPTSLPVTGAAEAPAAQPKDEITASRLAIIAKREASFQKEREELKKEREAFLAEKAESDRYRERGKTFDETFAKDKRAALKMIGLSDTDIINIMAGEEQPEETAETSARRIAQEEAQKIRDELAKEKETIAAERNSFLIKQLKTDITTKIKAGVDKFEYTAAEGAEGELQVYAFIEEDLKANKDDPNYTMLTVEEALEMAEGYFEERDKMFDAIKKRKARLSLAQSTAAAAPPESTSPSGAQAARGASAGTAPTSNAGPARASALTNEMTATGAAIANSRSVRRETEAEKKARIVAKIQRGEYGGR